MRIVPDSTITLYQNVDIDNDEQLVFSSLSNQTAYFQSKIHPNGAYTPCTVVRKTGRIRVEKSGSIVSACNYISFVNPSFDNKTIYARILDYEYVNNECTEIDYVIDYWQTWMFDVTFQDMYIEREHLSQADWDKAQTNPYDPTILEFKTNENLPCNTSIEKPYYSFGSTANDDGVYCAEAVCTELEVPRDVGVLFMISDINFKNLDDNIPAGQTTPSSEFVQILNDIKIEGGGSLPINWYRLTTGAYTYLNTRFPSIIQSALYRGDGWNTSVGNLYPGSSSLKPPIIYIYIEGGASITSEFETASSYVSRLLDWLTRMDALDSLIGIYPIPSGMMLFSGSSYNSPLAAQQATAKGQNVVNKKLDLFPYSYYRLMGPNGDVKELKIEDFKSAQDGLNACQVGLSLDITEKPNLIVAPVSYKAAGAAPHNVSANLNVREGLMFTQFPTLPYSIDAFRAQLAAVSNSIIGNNTVQTMNELNYRGKKLADRMITDLNQAGEGTTTAATGMLTGQGTRGGVAKAANAGMDALNIAAYESKMYDNEAKMRNQAYASRVNPDNAIYDNYQFTKPAYACDIYSPVNGDGILNFNYNSFVDILFMRVSLNPTILAQYDRYFSNYGYASGRCGIPRVINYSRGESSDALVPHWQTLNGKLTTYIKTTNCRVIHSMLPVAQFIKVMFDGGVRMIKGDPT